MSPEVVKIGLITPLTGPSSGVGLGIRNGFNMIFNESDLAKNHKRRTYEIIIKDDKNDEDLTYSSLRELEAEGCSIIIVATTSGAARKAINYGNDRDILMLSPTVSDDYYMNKQDNLIRLVMSASEYGTVLADIALKKSKRALVISDINNKQYADLIAGSFRERVLSENIDLSDFSFNSQDSLPGDEIIKKAVLEKVDSILMISASKEAALLCKYIEKEGLDIQVYLPPWSLTQDLIKNGGDAVEGIIASSPVNILNDDPASLSFIAAYKSIYSENPSYTARLGYDQGLLLWEILNNSQKIDPVSIKNYILQKAVFNFKDDVIEINNFGDSTKTVHLYTVQNGEFKSFNE